MASAECEKVYNIEDLWELLILLHPACSKWRYIGDGLMVPNGNLEAINSDYENVQDRLRAMLVWRLSNESITVNELCMVLRQPIVGEGDMADTLKRRECHNRLDINVERDSASCQQITSSNFLNSIDPCITQSVFSYRILLRLNKYPIISRSLSVLVLLLVGLSVLDDKAFRPNEEHMNRIGFFALRFILFIFTPIMLYIQLSVLGELEERSSNHHNIHLSPQTRKQVKDIIKKQNTALNLRCFQIKLIPFQILTHAVLLPILLYNMGIMRHPHTDNPRIGEHSFRQILQTANGTQVIEIWECISIGVILLVLGVTKHLYSLENHLTTVIAENDPPYKFQVFEAIRERWFTADLGFFLVSALFIGFTGCLLIWGGPFIIDNNNGDYAVQTLNLLTILIPLFHLFGSSVMPELKLLSLVIYFFIYSTALTDLFSCATENIQNYLLDAPGYVPVICYTVEVVTILNWLYSLLCSFHHNQTKTWKYHIRCLLMGLLIASLCAVVVQELKYQAIWKAPVETLRREAW